jgi:O-antigen ligase
LSWFEISLLICATVLAVALHLSPILNSSLAIPLTALFGAISYLSPVSGFFFVATTQFLPFPDGARFNPAQIGVLIWLPVVLLRYQRLNLGKIWLLWPVLPWLFWLWVLTQEAIYLPNGDYVKALFYSVIACQLAAEARGQYLKCLLGLCLGSLPVMAAYWCYQVGLPVEIQDWGGDREGFARMGGVRADAVMVWPALLIGVSGLLGLQVSLASSRNARATPKWLSPLTAGLIMAALPPLVSTMSHGAYAGFGLVLAAFLWALWLAKRAGAFSNPRFRKLINTLVLAVFLVAVLFAVDAFQLRTKMSSLARYYAETSQEAGAAASRTGVWHDSINTILKYPLFGIRVTGDQEEITSEYGAAGGYLSHNIFLDYGRAIGIPGMLLLAFFFFWPAIKMWQSGNHIRYLPFLLAHFALFIFWMSLSFTFYKTFWALWMLMTVAVAGNQSQARPVFKKRRERTGSGQNTTSPVAVRPV